MFRAGDTVRLGNGSVGKVQSRLERAGFSGFRVEITASADPLQVGRTVAASPAGMTRVASRSAQALVQLGGQRVACEVARTQTEKSTGLQRHAGLHDSEGMIFPFSPAQHVQFHMGSVPFPIDIVFCNQGRVARIVDNVQPGARDRWGARCDNVIEVRGGWCAENGVRVGTSVQTSELKTAAQSYDVLRTLTTAQAEEPAPTPPKPKQTAVGASRLFDELEQSGRMPSMRGLAAEIYATYLQHNPEAVERQSLSQIEADRIVQSWECKARWLEELLKLVGQDLLPGYDEDPKVYQQQFEWRLADQLNGVMGAAHEFYKAHETQFNDLAPYMDSFADDRAATLRSNPVYAKAAQQLILYMTPAPLGPEYMKPGGDAETQFYELLDLYDDKASEKKIDKAWAEVSKDMGYLDRDAVVRALVESGYPDAVRLLKSAQMHSEPDVRQDVKTPGAVRHTPPDQSWSNREIPADTVGVGDSADPSHWDQQIGYDVSNPDLSETTAPMRMGSRTAGGDIHPGDRARATEKADGLKDDQKGVCLEVQGDAVWIKFDGEPVPRWLKNDMVTQDDDKDTILQEIDQEAQEKQQEGGGEGDDGGGLAGLLGAMG